MPSVSCTVYVPLSLLQWSRVSSTAGGACPKTKGRPVHRPVGVFNPAALPKGEQGSVLNPIQELPRRFPRGPIPPRPSSMIRGTVSKLFIKIVIFYWFLQGFLHMLAFENSVLLHFIYIKVVTTLALWSPHPPFPR